MASDVSIAHDLGPFIPDATFKNATTLRRAARAALNDWRERNRRAWLALVDAWPKGQHTGPSGFEVRGLQREVAKWQTETLSERMTHAQQLLACAAARGEWVWLQKTFARQMPLANATELADWCSLEQDCIDLCAHESHPDGILAECGTREMEDEEILGLASPLLRGTGIVAGVMSIPYKIERYWPDEWCPGDGNFRLAGYVGEKPVERLTQQAWEYAKRLATKTRPPEPIGVDDWPSARRYLDSVIGWCEAQDTSAEITRLELQAKRAAAAAEEANLKRAELALAHARTDRYLVLSPPKPGEPDELDVALGLAPAETATTKQAAEDGFVEAGTIWRKHDFDDVAPFKRFLKEYGVDNHQKGQRRMVNAAQCLRALAERDKKAQEALDVAGEMAQGIKERTEAERDKSLGRKRARR